MQKSYPLVNQRADHEGMATIPPPRHRGSTRSGRAFRASRARNARSTHPSRHLLTRLGRTKLRAAAVAAVTIAGLAFPLLSTSQSNAVPTPTKPTFTKAMEPLPKFDSEAGCHPGVKPGTARLASLIQRTYPGSETGTAAYCGSRSGASSHDDGRAIDWMRNSANPTQAAQVEAFINWLNADNYAMARRLGVMYIIWKKRIFGYYNTSRGWKTQNMSCSGRSGYTLCHYDHLHISLTIKGSLGATSFWNGASSSGGGSNNPAPVAAPAQRSTQITPRLLYTADDTWRDVTKGQLISIGGDAARPNSTLQMYMRTVRLDGNDRVVAGGNFKPYLTPAKANSQGLWIKRYLVGVDHQVYVKSSDGKVSKTLLVTVD